MSLQGITEADFFMDANPILAELVRGNWVENRYRGAFVVSEAQGNVIASAGDIDRPVFPRSAVKSMQAVALGVSTAHYVDRDHAVQQEVRSGIETILHEPLNTDRCGTDGCSIPTWAAPLRQFAAGFARMAKIGRAHV